MAKLQRAADEAGEQLEAARERAERLAEQLAQVRLFLSKRVCVCNRAPSRGLRDRAVWLLVRLAVGV